MNTWNVVVVCSIIWFLGVLVFYSVRSGKLLSGFVKFKKFKFWKEEEILVRYREDSDLIISSQKIQVAIIYEDEDDINATSVADLVINYKDLVSGTYKVPEKTQAKLKSLTDMKTSPEPVKAKPIKTVEEKQEQVTDQPDPVPADKDDENIPDEDEKGEAVKSRGQYVDISTLGTNF